MLWFVVLAVSCSLILVGALIWSGNSWALLPDSDPGTSFDSSILFKALADAIDCEDLDPDGDGQVSLILRPNKKCFRVKNGFTNQTDIKYAACLL